MKKLMAILLLLALCLPFWTRSVSAAESTVTLFGQEFDSSAEFLDLSGIQMGTMEGPEGWIKVIE